MWPDQLSTGGRNESRGNPLATVIRTYGGRECPTASVSDSDLIAQVARGEQAAMAHVYDRYSSIVYSVALRVLGDTGNAEDVMQEVFLALWRNPNAYQAARGTLAAWLAVIARNRAIDQVRRRRDTQDVDEMPLAVHHNLENEAVRGELIGRVRLSLETMPAEQRSALELAYFKGMTHTQIAASTQLPLGTVKTRIRSALQALRKTLE
jgi:RNA polymerase sigma-70 factor, ECF subfamily